MKNTGNISSKFLKCFLLLFVGLALGCLPPAMQPPAGNTQSRCNKYAKKAVAQNQENISKGCGFTGGRWLFDYNTHYQWCVGVPQGFADSETGQREIALTNNCPGTRPSQTPSGGGSWSGPEVRCKEYAMKAVEQNNENISKVCGFSGPEWSSDYNTHFKWCVNKPKEDADFGASYRESALKSYCP